MERIRNILILPPLAENTFTSERSARKLARALNQNVNGMKVVRKKRKNHEDIEKAEITDDITDVKLLLSEQLPEGWEATQFNANGEQMDDDGKTTTDITDILEVHIGINAEDKPELIINDFKLNTQQDQQTSNAHDPATPLRSTRNSALHLPTPNPVIYYVLLSRDNSPTQSDEPFSNLSNNLNTFAINVLGPLAVENEIIDESKMQTQISDYTDIPNKIINENEDIPPNTLASPKIKIPNHDDEDYSDDEFPERLLSQGFQLGTPIAGMKLEATPFKSENCSILYYPITLTFNDDGTVEEIRGNSICEGKSNLFIGNLSLGNTQENVIDAIKNYSSYKAENNGATQQMQRWKVLKENISAEDRTKTYNLQLIAPPSSAPVSAPTPAPAFSTETVTDPSAAPVTDPSAAAVTESSPAPDPAAATSPELKGGNVNKTSHYDHPRSHRRSLKRGGIRNRRNNQTITKRSIDRNK